MINFIKEQVKIIKERDPSISCDFEAFLCPSFKAIMAYKISHKLYLNKMNLYSTIGAQNNKDKGKKAGVVKDIVLRPFLAFLKMYLLKGGILEGWIGFVLCLTYANYTLNKYVKLKLFR